MLITYCRSYRAYQRNDPRIYLDHIADVGNMIVTQTRVNMKEIQNYVKLAKCDEKTGIWRDCLYKDGHEYDDLYEIGVYFRADLLGTRILGGVWGLYKYLCLKAYATGIVSCKIALLPEKLKKTRKTIQVHIEYLIDLGFIRRIPNGFYVSQVYYIKPIAKMPVKRTETRRETIKIHNPCLKFRRAKSLKKRAQT